jgi:xanthine dehydrogenase molybdenum-binding subunit
VVGFTLNGSDVTVGEHPHLLAALREELDVTSPKDGCAPSGQCGCCTVLVDGKATVSCNLSLAKVEGRSVTTLEGLDQADRDRFTTAFAATGALQCGFCTPGIVLRAKYLLDHDGAALTRDKTARHLGAHLCRCTGYHPILDAIGSLATDTADAAAPTAAVTEVPLPCSTKVGDRAKRYEFDELAMGEKAYVDDLRVDGMLHAAVVLAEHARADVVAIDTSAAEAEPGVVGVVTAADVPGELRIGLIHRDWPVFIPVGGRTSYLGDVLALVVADDKATARRVAAELVHVEYRPLPPITDAAAAIEPDAEDAVWQLDGNVLSRSAYARGDVDEALGTSAHTVHEVFTTQRIEHAFLEPETTLAVPHHDGDHGDPGDRTLEVFSGGQGVWDDRRQIADVLGIAEERVLVHLVANGGAFGGKEDCANQTQTALAAWLLGRPVKCALSREESLLVHAKRHPLRIEAWAGCDADGHLTALRARMVGDSGPYASVGMKVLERAAGHAGGPYVWPAIDVEAIAARTNNPVCGAFRGFGANQAQFATEGLIDRLAEACGLDAWEMRARNAIAPGAVWGPGQIMDNGCLGVRACLDAIRPAWQAATADPAKAVGLGIGLKNSGLGNGLTEVAKAVVHFHPANGAAPERGGGIVEVRHCWTEMGQGVHTVALQVAAQELGVDPGRIRVVVDTSRELGAGQTTGSRGTLMGAGAVADACRRACEDGCRPGVDYVGEYTVDWTSALGTTEHPTIHSAFGYAAQLIVVDRATGAVDKVVAAHDVGKAVNPLLCEGQVLGAVHMGLGYALSEDLPTDEEARPTATTLRQLGIIRPKDMPPVEVILVEKPQPKAPYGIKGVGEIGLVPTAGAVAAALHDRDGTWRTALPMTP